MPDATDGRPNFGINSIPAFRKVLPYANTVGCYRTLEKGWRRNKGVRTDTDSVPNGTAGTGVGDAPPAIQDRQGLRRRPRIRRRRRLTTLPCQLGCSRKAEARRRLTPPSFYLSPVRSRLRCRPLRGVEDERGWGGVCSPPLNAGQQGIAQRVVPEQAVRVSRESRVLHSAVRETDYCVLAARLHWRVISTSWVHCFVWEPSVVS